MTETIPDEVIEKMANASWREAWEGESDPAPITAALKAAESLGWVMVPMEATEAMRETAKAARARQPEGTVPGMSMADAYRAMIAARPKVP